MDFGLSWQLYSLNEAVDMKLVRKVGPTCLSWAAPRTISLTALCLMAVIKHALAHFAPTCRKTAATALSRNFWFWRTIGAALVT